MGIQQTKFYNMPKGRGYPYMRRCRRCGKIYKTTAKFGRYCPNCRLNHTSVLNRKIEEINNKD